MNINIKDIRQSDIVFVSDTEKKSIINSKKNYISWNDKWITIEESYKNVLNKLNKLK